MSTTPWSQSRSVFLAANVFGTLGVGFGINAILRPESALSFFEFTERPVSPIDAELVDRLMVIYGIRDVFVGAAIFATAIFGSRKALGWILIAFSGVAFTDGAVCWQAGKGEWAHWSYAPMVTAVGALLLGVLDK